MSFQWLFWSTIDRQSSAMSLMWSTIDQQSNFLIQIFVFLWFLLTTWLSINHSLSSVCCYYGITSISLSCIKFCLLSSFKESLQSFFNLLCSIHSVHSVAIMELHDQQLISNQNFNDHRSNFMIVDQNFMIANQNFRSLIYF